MRALLFTNESYVESESMLDLEGPLAHWIAFKYRFFNDHR